MKKWFNNTLESMYEAFDWILERLANLFDRILIGLLVSGMLLVILTAVLSLFDVNIVDLIFGKTRY